MSRGGRGRGRGRGGGSSGGGGLSGAAALVPFEMIGQTGEMFRPPEEKFPKMELPVPKNPSSIEKDQLNFLKEYRQMLKDSPFYLRPPLPSKDIERYSDKYKIDLSAQLSLRHIRSNLAFFPEELHQVLDSSKIPKKKTAKKRGNLDLKVLDELEKEDNDAIRPHDEDGDDEQKEPGEEEELEELEEDEEEAEDETDYGLAYFDNGEGDDLGDDFGDDAVGEDFY